MNMNFDRFINKLIAEHTDTNSQYHILSIAEEYPSVICNKDCFMSLPCNNINEVGEHVLSHLDDVYTNYIIPIQYYNDIDQTNIYNIDNERVINPYTIY